MGSSAAHNSVGLNGLFQELAWCTQVKIPRDIQTPIPDVFKLKPTSNKAYQLF
jgi:hypothetical protein